MGFAISGMPFAGMQAINLTTSVSFTTRIAQPAWGRPILPASGCGYPSSALSGGDRRHGLPTFAVLAERAAAMRKLYNPFGREG